MANTILFDEGATYLQTNGLPATCYFLLSTKGVDVGAPNQFAHGDTLAGGLSEISAVTVSTGYGRKNQARPSMSGFPMADAFSQMTWTTGSATDWPNNVRSIVLATSSDNSGKAICAANLQAGGAARDLSTANTTEKVTPTLSIVPGN